MKTGHKRLLIALGAGLMLAPAWAASTAPEPPAPPAPPEAPTPPTPPTPPEPPEPPVIAHAGHPGIEQHRHIVRYVDHDDARHERPGGEQECNADTLRAGTDVVTEDDKGSQRTRILICADKIKRETYAEVIAALREARDEIAREDELPEKHRTRALAELDREIARIERERSTK